MNHLVKFDESLRSIAHDVGMSWETIWNHPKNAILRAKRVPQVLRNGDVVFIPPIEPRKAEAAVGKRHHYTKATSFETLKIQLILDGKKRRPDGWRLEVDGCPPIQEDPAEPSLAGALRTLVATIFVGLQPTAEADGTTFGARCGPDGLFAATIPSQARSASLLLVWKPNRADAEPAAAALSLRLRALQPADDVLGACQRARNLGYDVPLTPHRTPQVDRRLLAVTGATSWPQATGILRDRHGS